MQKKKKTGAVWYIILEILIGVLIAHFFLMDALENKRFLKPVVYAYSGTEQVVSETASLNAETEALTDAVSSDSSDASADAVAGTGEVSEGSVRPQADAAETDSAETEAQTAASESIEFSVADVSDVSGTVTGTKVEIVSASESSVVEQEGHDNTAYQAYDGNLTTSWQEGVDGAGEGSWLSFTFDGTYQVSSIVFYLGVWREAEGKDYYHDNYRPSMIQISMGGQTWEVPFSDEKVAHVVTFSSPVEASEVTFTILSVYDTNHYDDTGIAEIMVMAS